jgi:hypothetical protein
MDPLEVQYYVLSPDGQKYGPATMAVLKQWVTEGRLSPGSELESVADMSRFRASSFPDLFPPGSLESPNFSSAPPRPPTPYSPPAKLRSDQDVTVAWVCVAVGFVFCGFAHIPAFLYAKKAKEAGNPNASGPYVVSIIGLVLTAVGCVAVLAVVGLGALSPPQR